MLIAVAAIVAVCLILTLPRIPQDREWARRRARGQPEKRARGMERNRPVVSSPKDAASILIPRMERLTEEHLVLLVLDIRHRLLGEPVEMGQGKVRSAPSRVGEVLRKAVQANAASIILAHNHPKGDPSPTAEDVSLTQAIVQAGRLVDIALLDHLVIGSGTFVSMRSQDQASRIWS